MAIAVSLDSLLASGVSASSSSYAFTPQKSLTFRRCFNPGLSTLPNPFLTLSLSHGPTSAVTDYNRRKRSSSRIFSTGTGSDPSTSHEEGGYKNYDETSEADVPRSYPSDMKSLMRIYRESISHGDEKTKSEIEIIIRSMEMKKNELDTKVLALSGEIASGKEKYIRSQADFDNFRKRYEKDRLKTQSNAQREVIESLLPLIDSFEGARKQMKPKTEKEKKVDSSYQGIYKQFVEVMRSLNVSAIATIGRPFDPSLHEAISREESQDIKEGFVTQEIERGFLLGDEVLRHAKVKVSAGPGSKKTPSTPEQPGGIATAVDGR